MSALLRDLAAVAPLLLLGAVMAADPRGVVAALRRGGEELQQFAQLLGDRPSLPHGGIEEPVPPSTLLCTRVLGLLFAAGAAACFIAR